MLIAIPDVLDAAGLADVRAIIDAAAWIDGNETSGAQAALAKRNMQLPQDGDAARAAGRLVMAALNASPMFIAAALPAKLLPPLFNRYAGGQDFGAHVDNAIRFRGPDLRLRADLSATLFLADPDSYDGGELVVEEQFGEQRIKLPAGHMVLYPSSSLHRVEPVTRGVRVASFFWVQSMVRGAEDRRTLFEIDQVVQSLVAERGHGHRDVLALTSVYHNLLRRWAEV